MKTIEKNLLIYYARKLIKTHELIDDSMYKFILQLLTASQIRLIVKKYCKEDSLKSYHRDPIRRGQRNTQNYKIAHVLECSEAQANIHKDLLLMLPNKRFVQLPKVEEIAKIFELSSLEADMLQLAYFRHFDEELDSACDHCYEHGSSAILGSTRPAVEAALGEQEKLFANGLFVVDRRRWISDTIFSYIYGESPSLLEYTCRQAPAKYAMSSFPQDKEDINVVVSLIQRVSNAKILIHGACGTGKSEFAAAMAESCGLRAYFLKDKANEKIAIAASNPATDLVVVDEADDIINESFFSQKMKKGDVNLAFDESKRKCIYIANHISMVDRSILRRFHFIMEFKPLQASERATMWQNNIVSLGEFMSKTEIKHTATEYNLPLGIAAHSADAALALSDSKKGRTKYFKDMLESHAKFYAKEQVQNGNKFCIDFVNSSIPAIDIIEHAICYKKSKNLGKKRFSLLLHGLPGTGKTEFAKYMATQMKLDAQVVHISDILSMYVGGSEKNIRAAFQSAAGKVLIFDEADSMLYNREGAERSWERSHVNEFLAQMDAYKGVLVCTTNFLQTLDPAAIRRFDIKAEFRPLAQGQIAAAIKHFFPTVDFASCNDRLATLKSLTAADIAIAADRFWRNAEDVLTALENEISYKPKTVSIGF
ncbi:MAG: AAA family ATPase [Deferribacteraceae bacterium]|jgi:AAA+ superfamily predicted ATPase|nr:AAA family ATPase [Deferribacteraceae bacterium]